MAIDINILTRKKSELSIVKAQGQLLTDTLVNFDISASENHGLASELTEFPVADGSIISDHRIIKPVTISFEGVISETPIQIFGGAFGLIESQKNLTDEWGKIEKIWREGETVEITTGLKTYKNMVCLNVNTTRDTTTGKSILIKADFKTLLRAETELVTLDANIKQDDSAIASNASTTKDKGTSTPTSTQTSSKANSWAVSLSDLLGF